MKLYCAAVLVALVLAASLVHAGEDTHRYTPKESVPVYASKIGPMNNPLETYDFFKEPGCPPASDEMKPPSLGQALAGDELYPMNMHIQFNADKSNNPICLFKPTPEQLARLEYMIRNQYTYKLVVDGLPVKGLLGEVVGEKAFIFTSVSLHLAVNDDQIVGVSLKTGGGLPVAPGVEYQFTFTSRFTISSIKFQDRYAVNVNDAALYPRVRWVAVVNSVLIVLFLATVVLIIISRTLKADFEKMDEERRLRSEGLDTFDDSGWKQLHGDVYRLPKWPALFAGVIGSGSQLWILLLLAIIFGALNSQEPAIGEYLSTFALAAYAATSLFSGLVSSTLFASFATRSPSIARHWTRCFGITQFLLPGLFFASSMATNVVAIAYGSSKVIHFRVLLQLFALWLFVSCPLSLVGTIFARYGYRRSKQRKEVPHVNQIPRLIPKPRRLVTSPFILFLLCGVLPFLSIFVETFLVLSAFWGESSYQIYGVLAITVIIYTIVTACTAVTATYILLSTENHNWRWMSVAFGASCSLYVFLYSVYFFVFKTKMSGFFMTAFYFSYSFFGCTVFAVAGGSIAYLAAGNFVNKIYSQAKKD